MSLDYRRVHPLSLNLTLGHSHHPFGPPRLAPGNGSGSVGSVAHGGSL